MILLNYTCGPEPNSGEFSLQVAGVASEQAVRSKDGSAFLAEVMTFWLVYCLPVRTILRPCRSGLSVIVVPHAVCSLSS